MRSLDWHYSILNDEIWDLFDEQQRMRVTKKSYELGDWNALIISW
jgi:hypothetical protein